MDKQGEFRDYVRRIYKVFLLFFLFVGVITVLLVYMIFDPSFSAFKTKPDETYEPIEVVDVGPIEDGIHVSTGLIAGEGLATVISNCTSCHSAKLITQNRMDRERWAATIDWMQETQNLWELGDNEEVIIDYLVTNYPVEKKGRRQNLTAIDWYDLEQ